MGLFERYLTVWVGLGILAGVGLGLLAPGAFQAIAGLEFAQVNLVVAVFIWVMVYPMMIQIDVAAVKDVGRRPRGLVLTETGRMVLDYAEEIFRLGNELEEALQSRATGRAV